MNGLLCGELIWSLLNFSRFFKNTGSRYNEPVIIYITTDDERGCR